MGDLVVEFDDYFEILKPIDINNLLREVNLPVRLVNSLKQLTFYSEDSFFETVERLVLEHTSHYLFPNRLVSFYPQVR